jgi:hypothetical protein
MRPSAIQSVDQLEDLLSAPTPSVTETFAKIPGDIMVLGVGGKMGPSLARMARRASELAGVKRRVIGVSRFSSPELPEQLAGWGVETIPADLLDVQQLEALPEIENIVYMAGMKFGSTGNEALTWAMNTFLPGQVCRKFRGSRIVAFSTGNIYGLAPLSGGGSVEGDVPNPVGEYAMSCLGRERILEHHSRSLNIPMSVIRLNYAVEMRYGVIVDLALKLDRDEPVDLSMGNANVIWQGDANAHALQSFDHAASPPFVLNVSGPEMLSIRRVAEQLGSLMGKTPQFVGSESSTALLNNAQLAHRLFGPTAVPVRQVIEWTANWIGSKLPTHRKPTHFESRSGQF